MRLLRPRYLTVAVAAYFAIVTYLAYHTARTTQAAWFDPSISQVVYQTSLVGGVLLLAGLFIVASIAPRVTLATRPSPATRSLRRRRVEGPRLQPAEGPARGAHERDDAEWDQLEQFLDNLPNVDGPAEPGMVRIQETAPPAPVSDRSEPEPAAYAAGTLTERLSLIRSRNTVVVYPEARDSTKVLSRLANDMTPLLQAARRVGLSGHEVQKLMGEPTTAAEADFAQRVRLAEHAKATLEMTLVDRISEELQEVLLGIEKANAAAEQARAAELIAAEAITLLDTGNYLAAIDRVERARETFKVQAATPWSEGEKMEAPTSFVALAGPAIGAIGYVAVSSMLLPGVFGFLERNFELNTTAILALSYGWAGLLVYALTSVYLALRPAPQ